MVNIFWNREERRLRAFWRLLFQTLLLLLFSVLASWTAVIVGIKWLGVDSSQLMNSDWSTALDVLAEKDLTMVTLITVASLIGVLASVWLAGKVLDRRSFADFGLHFNRKWWEDFSFGLFLGALLLSVVFFAEWALGWIEIKGFFISLYAPFATAVGVGLLNYICVGIREELLSRGYHFTNIAEGLRFVMGGEKTAWLLAYILSSAFFGLLHLGNPNATLMSTVNLMLAGILLGMGYYLTRELAIPIGLHITWNFFQGKVYGFPVSGLGTASSVIAIQQKGPDLWTGGAFGPEAGLLGLIAMILGCFITVLWVRARR